MSKWWAWFGRNTSNPPAIDTVTVTNTYDAFHRLVERATAGGKLVSFPSDTNITIEVIEAY